MKMDASDLNLHNEAVQHIHQSNQSNPPNHTIQPTYPKHTFQLTHPNPTVQSKHPNPTIHSKPTIQLQAKTKNPSKDIQPNQNKRVETTLQKLNKGLDCN